MKADLTNRTGHHNYTIDINSDTLTAPVSEFNNEALVNNPLYVVNYNQTDKNVNIARQKINDSNRDILGSLRKAKNGESENIYQEPQDSVKDTEYSLLPGKLQNRQFSFESYSKALNTRIPELCNICVGIYFISLFLLISSNRYLEASPGSSGRLEADRRSETFITEKTKEVVLDGGDRHHHSG